MTVLHTPARSYTGVVLGSPGFTCQPYTVADVVISASDNQSALIGLGNAACKQYMQAPIAGIPYCAATTNTASYQTIVYYAVNANNGCRVDLAIETGSITFTGGSANLSSGSGATSVAQTTDADNVQAIHDIFGPMLGLLVFAFVSRKIYNAIERAAHHKEVIDHE